MEKLRFLLLPLLALTFVPFSMAQDSDEDVEEVVVTGSRITNPNIVSTSQVQVVTAEDIDNRGAVRIEEVLNDLPQLSPGQIAQTANGSNGTATANPARPKDVLELWFDQRKKNGSRYFKWRELCRLESGSNFIA